MFGAVTDAVLAAERRLGRRLVRDLEIGELSGEPVEAMPAEECPHLVEFTTEHVMKPGCSFADTFDFGLDLLPEGLESACA